MIYEQLNELCVQKGTTPTAFVKDVLHLSTSKVTAWKNGSIPKYEILNQIANYFGVSVGFLFDGKKNLPSELSEEETRMLNVFRSLTPADRLIEIGRIEGIAEKYPPELKESV